MGQKEVWFMSVQLILQARLKCYNNNVYKKLTMHRIKELVENYISKKCGRSRSCNFLNADEWAQFETLHPFSSKTQYQFFFTIQGEKCRRWNGPETLCSQKCKVQPENMKQTRMTNTDM